MKTLSITRHFRKFQLGGWILLWIGVLIAFLMPELVDTKTAGIPFSMLFWALMASGASIAFGDVLKLRSYRRRIRAVELVQAAAPVPVALFFVLTAVIGEDDISQEVLTFFILMILVFNMKGAYDLATRNREIVTCAEMKNLERLADEAGLSYLEMMERAGAEAFGYICEEEIDMIDKMLIFCGKGNNGGDGFVLGRLALDYGCDVTIVLPCGLPTTPDAITNYELIRDRIPIIIPEEGDDLAALVNEKIRGSDDPSAREPMEVRGGKRINDEDLVIVDAVFGTGFHGRPEGFPRKALDYMNDLRGVNSIYSLDVPSGLPGDLGHEDDPGHDLGHDQGEENLFEGFYAVFADCVITFHARKPVHVCPDPYISSHMRKIIVADIGITRALDPSLQD